MKTKPIKLASALKKIQKYKPNSVLAFKKLGFDMNYIAAGSFREVYQIDDLPIVVKFPLDDDPESNIDHTNREVRKIKKLHKVLPRHVPKIYYHDSRAGIVIMKYYDNTDDVMSGLYDMLSKLIYKTTGMKITDIYEENIRYDDTTDTIRFIDLAI